MRAALPFDFGEIIGSMLRAVSSLIARSSASYLVSATRIAAAISSSGTSAPHSLL